MREQLERIQAIKAEIKSALINAGINDVSDIFSDYPALIRSLKNIDNSVYSSFFELVPDEYIEQDEDGATVRYAKYKYIYSDDIFVAGAELSRKEKFILQYESSVPDCISFEYKGSDGKTYTAVSENNKISYKKSMDGMTITSAECPENVITTVNLYDYDVLTGTVLMEKIFYNNACDIEMFKAETYDTLSMVFTNHKIKSLHVKVSEKCTSLNAFVYGYFSKVADYIESFSIEGDTKVQDISNLTNNCYKLTGILELHSTELTRAFVPFANNKWNKIIFAGSTKNVKSFSNCFENCYELTGIYNLDFSKANSLSDCFRDDNRISSIVNCRIDNLGASISTIQQFNANIPVSENWCEDDIIYTFRNCAQRSGVMTLYSFTYDILEKNNLIPEINEKGWTVVKQ